jgi:N-acetylmuramoyl-L-alanine amidase
MAVRTASLVLVGAVLAAACLAAAGRVTLAGADSFPVATDVRLGGDEALTRFVLDLSRKIDLHAFTLADPYRVVVDIPQVTFHLPAKAGERGRGLVKAFRFGLVMQGGSRLVFDLAKPVRIDKAFVIDTADGHPARLVLDLVAVDRESFLRTIALDNRSVRPPPAARAAPAPLPDKSGDARPLVMLDPGHGGIDNGTRAGSGENEKAIVLEFAHLLRERIEKAGKYRVAMTRTDDTFVALAERVRMARAQGAALFVSIHADALPRAEGDAQGASIYTLSETASDSEAARLAEVENRADVIAGVDLKSEPDDVADILIDLAQRETKTFSVQFARTLIADMKPVARLHKKPLKSAGFRVLRAPDVPSVLIELGYVSNQADLKSLVSDSWRSKTADSIAHAIDTFFSRRVAGTGARGMTRSGAN